MGNKVIKSSVLIMIIMVITKILGLIREVVFANYLGTSHTSDAYILGITISQIVIAGFAGAFLNTYVPIAIEERLINESRFEEYTRNLLFFSLGVFLFISLLTYSFADILINFIGHKASDEVFNAAVFICRYTAIPSALFIVINIFQGYFHVKEKFLVNIVYPLMLNITFIIILILWKGDLKSLGNAYNFALISTTIIFLTSGVISGLRNKNNYSFKFSNSINKTFVITLPLLIGGLVSQFNEIIDRMFSAYYETGIVSSLRYGKLVEILIVSVISISICQAMYPKLNNLVKTKQFDEGSKLLSNILNIFIILNVPIFFGILAIGREFIEVVFMHGAFNMKSLNISSIDFLFFCLSILPVSVNELLSRAFYSLDDTQRPVKFSMISMGINIILNIAAVVVFKLSFYFLAITTSVSETILAVIYLISIRKTQFQLKVSYKLIGTAFLASIMMYVVLQKISVVYLVNGLVGLMIMIVIGIVIYAVIFTLLNIELIKKIILKRF